MENKMKITVIDISDEDLFIGAKVRNIKSKKEFFIIRDNEKMTFDTVHLSLVMMNKHLFELVPTVDVE